MYSKLWLDVLLFGILVFTPFLLWNINFFSFNFNHRYFTIYVTWCVFHEVQNNIFYLIRLDTTVYTSAVLYQPKTATNIEHITIQNLIEEDYDDVEVSIKVCIFRTSLTRPFDRNACYELKLHLMSRISWRLYFFLPTKHVSNWEKKSWVGRKTPNKQINKQLIHKSENVSIFFRIHKKLK